MKYVLLIVLSLILVLILYAYFRARYIERNIDFKLGVSKIGIKEGQLLDALDKGEIRFNATFTLNIINKSNFSTRLRKLRVVFVTESGNLSVYSEEIKSIKIPKYESTLIELPSEIILKSAAIGEAIQLMRGEKLSVNYKVFAKIMVFPLFYEGTIEI